MISSKELLRQANISRATLNNYIAQGILPKPQVRRPGEDRERAPRIGYFPDTALDVIDRVSALKKTGHTMAEIVEMMKTSEMPSPERNSTPEPAHRPQSRRNTIPFEVIETQVPGASLRLTLDAIAEPAYMVNNRFELEWWNEAATGTLFGQTLAPSAEISERNLFKLLCDAGDLRRSEGWDVLLDFHLSIAKNRLSKKSLLTLDGEIATEDLDLLVECYDEAEAITTRAMIKTEVNLGPRGGDPAWHNVYASFFREGIFFVFEQFDEKDDDLTTFLARRDVVIRELLRNRRPYLTPVAVLVADLQASTKICAELPPEEYFQLVNSIWTTMEPKLRKYKATHGKHVGDGMVYYFLPQPDSNHVYNAILCAQEMKEAMREVSRQWRNRKNWLNELKLNIGIHEGEEWFGTYQTPTQLEFTVLGDTINQAARLSDFARNGSLWVTKNVVGKLTGKERQSLHYGIRRQADNREEVVVPSTYSRISNLIDLDNAKYEKFRDIAVLAVTEVIDVQPQKD